MRTETPAVGPAIALGLGGVIAAAAVLRAIGLQSGLWYDEIVTLVISARLPVGQILTEFPGVNAHPLYSLLAHSSIAAFGEAAWSLRLPAMAFGVASVAMVYVLGAKLVSRLEALAGAAVLATSYHHIWFSQNARGYTMLGFFTLWSTYLLLRAGESGRTRDYAWYAIACAAGVYTHLTMAFVVAGQAAAWTGARVVGWRAADRRLAPVLWAWSGAAALSAVLYAPFIPALIAQLGSEAPRQAARVATGRWAIAEAVRAALSGAGVPAALLGGVMAVVGGMSLLRRSPVVVAILVVPAVVTGLAILAMGQPLRPRFFFFLSGAAAIFAGRGLGRLSELAGGHGARATATALLCGTAVLITASAVALPRNYELPKQDFDGAVTFLDAEASAGARIAAAGPACLPLADYYGKPWSCLKTVDDLRAFTAPPGPALVVMTLVDYIEDPGLGDRLRTTCREVRRLPGTLGGGDMVVCDPRGQEAP